MKNYYEILEVNEKASSETISKVYKFLAKKYHPDANPDNKQESEEKFKEISEAYEVLSNQEKRKEYDKELEEYEASNASQTVSLEDFIKLRDYCKELENTINQYSSNRTNSNASQYRTNNQPSEHSTQAEEQARVQAYEDAVNRAYHDAYINSLKNMGYKIKYKKTFKDYLKNFLTLILSIIATILIIKIALSIPTINQTLLILKK